MTMFTQTPFRWVKVYLASVLISQLTNIFIGGINLIYVVLMQILVLCRYFHILQRNKRNCKLLDVLSRMHVRENKRQCMRWREARPYQVNSWNNLLFTAAGTRSSCHRNCSLLKSCNSGTFSGCVEADEKCLKGIIVLAI